MGPLLPVYTNPGDIKGTARQTLAVLQTAISLLTVYNCLIPLTNSQPQNTYIRKLKTGSADAASQSERAHPMSLSNLSSETLKPAMHSEAACTID